jgi:xanthine dehydrogenase large subunit
MHRDHAPVQATRAVGAPLAHESAHLHVTGRAAYVDDLPELRGTLHAAIGMSARAHATLAVLNLDAVRGAPGVAAVITARDIPGSNAFGPILDDDPILAEERVQYRGQPIFALAAESHRAARWAARQARATYTDLPALLTVDAALAAGSHVLPSERLQKGEPDAAIAAAAYQLQGEIRIGGQEHFYLEGMVAYAVPGEEGGMRVYCSTQHPTEVQHKVAQALGLACKDVVVECRRMGGGFGGKESQPALIACIAALLAKRTGRPVKLRLDRDDDFAITGKRHDFLTRYHVGFDDAGRVHGIVFELASRCGHSADLSGAINDRAMLHSDNCYFLPDIRIVSHRCKTHTASNTAFRGFGGPQGMLGIEQVMDDIARHLGLDPLAVRRANLYGVTERNLTPYGQPLEDNVLPEILARLLEMSDYAVRRAEVAEHNARDAVIKRGLALTPVKFGISFTTTRLNQAGCLINIYTDGSVLINHGGTEMGQGLFIKVAQVVADELGVPLSAVHTCATDTSKVPNTSATAASSGADLNGKAAQAAARTLRERLAECLAAHLHLEPGTPVCFDAGMVRAGEQQFTFSQVAKLAWESRISLSATGYYRTPKIGYDRTQWTGRPFYYFCYGAALAEVAVDTLTGEHRVLRVDIVQDVGRSLNPAIDRGQIEGGFVQGMGWLTTEELVWEADGRLATHAPSTYKIPTAADVPRVFNVEFLAGGCNVERAIHRSKAVGEPPLMLAMSVWFAIKDAVAAALPPGARVRLVAPATPEAVLRALGALPP